MSFVGRYNASAVANGVANNGRMNKAGEIVSTPWATQMMFEGRVFIAGTGCEENGVAGTADLDETTPVFGLVSPAGGVVAIPLWFKVYYDTEAAAAPEHFHLVYVQKDKAAFSAGTLLPAINTIGGSNPRVAQAKLQHTLSSVTAITSAENVMLTSREHILTALFSVDGVTTFSNIEAPGLNIYELNWTPQFPIGLYAGSALYWYGIDATARYNVAAAWVEIPADVYLSEE